MHPNGPFELNALELDTTASMPTVSAAEGHERAGDGGLHRNRLVQAVLKLRLICAADASPRSTGEETGTELAGQSQQRLSAAVRDLEVFDERLHQAKYERC